MYASAEKYSRQHQRKKLCQRKPVLQRLNPDTLSEPEKQRRDTADAAQHPETQQFVAGMVRLGMSAANALDLWKLLLQGAQEQKTLNEDAQMGVSPDGSIISNETVRNNNRYYRDAARIAAGYLDVAAVTGKVGLWSGGYNLSAYAAAYTDSIGALLHS